MTAEPVIACTLGAGDFQARMAWIADLNRRHLKSQRREGMTLHLAYDPAGRDDVRELVRRESECCAFLSFAVAEQPDAITLTVTAPPTAAIASEEIFAGLLGRQGAPASASACGCC